MISLIIILSLYGYSPDISRAYQVCNYWSANGFRLACYSEVNGVLIPSYWEDSGGLLKGYWTASQNTLRLVSSTSFPSVRINVNIWYYEPCDLCSMSQGYISNITLVPGSEIMFTCTSDIVIRIPIILVTDLRVN